MPDACRMAEEGSGCYVAEFSAKRRGTRAMGWVDVEMPSRDFAGHDGDRFCRRSLTGRRRADIQGGRGGCAATTCRTGRRAVISPARRRMTRSSLRCRTERGSGEPRDAGNWAADRKQNRLCGDRIGRSQRHNCACFAPSCHARESTAAHTWLEWLKPSQRSSQPWLEATHW